MMGKNIKLAISTVAAAGIVLFLVTDETVTQELQPQAGDVKAGSAAAEVCIACHGAQGLALVPKTPHLAGQHAAYVVRALGYYRSGERQEARMEAIARELSDIDMLNLSAYYASLKPFTETAVKKAAAALPEDDRDSSMAAMTEATGQCANCHGPEGNSTIPGWPGLAGQHPRYLIAAMKAYREGSRPDPAMQTFAADMSDTLIEDISFYYAGIKPVAAPAPSRGDPYAGRAATRDCAGCHGTDGNTKDPKTPRLAGLDADYIRATLVAYKNGTRSHAAMQEAAAAIREADLDDISAFYATKEPKALPARKRLTTAEWVENCNRCHGPGGQSSDPRFPILAGQSESYLAGALKRYHNGDRANPMMVAMSYPMSEADINKLAAYYSNQVEK